MKLAIERTLDICGSLFVLLVSAPMFLAIAALIKLDSPGPVFFRQKRVGRHGTCFTLLKFRSMRRDASAQEEVFKLTKFNGQEEVFKLTNDPRITRIGRFIRRTSLDELPQLINVLRGEMSLIGPQPAIQHVNCDGVEGGLVRIAVLTEDPRHHILLQNGRPAQNSADVVFTDVRFPLDSPNPITPQIKNRRINVVIVDLWPENAQLASLAVRVIRMISPEYAIFVRVDKDTPADAVVDIRVWIDKYLDRNGKDDLQGAFEDFLRSRRSRQITAGKKRPPGAPPPPPAVPVHSLGDVIRISQSENHRWPASWTLASDTELGGREPYEGRARQAQPVESEVTARGS